MKVIYRVPGQSNEYGTNYDESSCVSDQQVRNLTRITYPVSECQSEIHCSRKSHNTDPHAIKRIKI
uniref:Uncharacterized protein n=1 Tax=Picea glauca TaxID=3330 RepID=A0A101LVA6_PICGL|nr:hypothetical protein ABT39_MTgene2110 [Picea glauca]